MKRYVNVKAKDVVDVMHRPEPTPQTAPTQPSSTAGGMTQEALHAAMQMLQAAAAQLNVRAASAAPTPVQVPARSAANDDGDVCAIV